MPLKTIDNARGRRAGGTRRIVTAAAMAQKPPSAMPSKTRITRSIVMLEETATSKLEAIINVEKARSTTRRSSPLVKTGTNRPETSATTAVTVTACPAKASDTPSSAAIGVSRLAGRYSAVSRPNTPVVSENTASHAADTGASCVTSSGSVLNAEQQAISVIQVPFGINQFDP